MKSEGMDKQQCPAMNGSSASGNPFLCLFPIKKIIKLVPVLICLLHNILSEVTQIATGLFKSPFSERFCFCPLILSPSSVSFMAQHTHGNCLVTGIYYLFPPSLSHQTISSVRAGGLLEFVALSLRAKSLSRTQFLNESQGWFLPPESFFTMNLWLS